MQAEQHQFFNELTGLSQTAVKNRYEALVTEEVTTDSFSQGGAFLPLGVWATKGFDTDRIKSKSRTCDIMEDDVLGTCYRVRILEVKTTGSRSKKRSSEAGANIVEGGAAVADKKKLLAIQDGKVDDTTSSSSSSSSSDKKKKKKHHKKSKAKKEKKSKRKSNKPDSEVCGGIW